MKIHGKKRFIKCIAPMVLVFFVGCLAVATDYRKVGFREIQKGFAMLERNRNLHETIEIPNVKVHVVGDRKFFKWGKAKTEGSRVFGYATNNEIYIFGALVKGKIVINQAILGHEFNHLLQFNAPDKFHNPDKLDDIGA